LVNCLVKLASLPLRRPARARCSHLEKPAANHSYGPTSLRGRPRTAKPLPASSSPKGPSAELLALWLKRRPKRLSRLVSLSVRRRCRSGAPPYQRRDSTGRLPAVLYRRGRPTPGRTRTSRTSRPGVGRPQGLDLRGDPQPRPRQRRRRVDVRRRGVGSPLGRSFP